MEKDQRRSQHFRIPASVRGLSPEQRVFALQAISTSVEQLTKPPQEKAIVVFEPLAQAPQGIHHALDGILPETIATPPHLPTEYPVPLT